MLEQPALVAGGGPNLSDILTMTLALYLFWTGLAIVFYTYVGYGIVLYVMTSFVRRKKPVAAADGRLPAVTLLIAAYNEQEVIANKIRNTLALDYPADKLKIFMVTDGSSDNTPEIVRKFPQVRLFHDPQRRGKIHAVNRVMKFVNTPYVVFCDANTFLNAGAIRNIVRHYDDLTVGGVAGEKRIFRKAADNASGSGEGFYWKYESFLKRKDAELYSVVGAAGELFSLRTALYEPPAENIIIEDFYMSLSIVASGYRFVYEPEAFATETASASVDEEWKRKVRICAGGFQAMGLLSRLLNPLRYGLLSFQYISHRVLRWTLAPAMLPVIFATNLVLASTGSLFYAGVMAAQFTFYGLAALGYRWRDKNISIRGFFIPYYFCVMNFSVYAGFLRYMRGRQTVLWERSQRAAMSS